MSGAKTYSGESTTARPFRLNQLTVEPQNGVISGLADRVQVDPQVMAVLLLLTRRAGEVVSREELLADVWQGRVVSDDALSRCVYQLRQHMSQAGGSREYRELIETLPKRGYRLNVTEPVAMPEPLEPTRSLPLKVLSLATLAALAFVGGAAMWVAERSTVRQPPTPNTRAYDVYVRANDYFTRSDRRTSLPYAVELFEEAAKLDPSFVPAQVGLARAHTDIYWHGIDRTPARLREAEGTLLRLFALDPELPEVRLARANYLLKGVNQFEDALKELDKAERLIPLEPELFFMRAMAHRRLGEWEVAINELDTALGLGGGNITYLRQQFVNYQFVRDYERAEQVLDRILELYPDDGTAYVDKVVLSLCRNGDTDLFRTYYESAPSKYYDDGLAYTYTSWLAAIFDRDYEAALTILDNSNEDPIFDGDFRNASFGPRTLFYARTHRLAGHSEEAREAYTAVVRLIEDEVLEGTDDDRTIASRYLALAEAQAGLGLGGAALESVRHAAAHILETDDALMGPALRLNALVRVLVPAGYDEEALRALEAYLSSAGHWSIEGLGRDPRLEALSKDPRFKVLEQQYARL